MLNLLNYQKTSLYAIVGDAIPHHARFSPGNGMLEGDLLAGVQCGIGMDSPESALAVVQQAADDFLRRGIVERKFELALAAVTAFGPAIGG
jgi:hypothetical protein